MSGANAISGITIVGGPGGRRRRRRSLADGPRHPGPDPGDRQCGRRIPGDRAHAEQVQAPQNDIGEPDRGRLSGRGRPPDRRPQGHGLPAHRGNAGNLLAATGYAGGRPGHADGIRDRGFPVDRGSVWVRARRWARRWPSWSGSPPCRSWWPRSMDSAGRPRRWWRSPPPWSGAGRLRARRRSAFRSPPGP